MVMDFEESFVLSKRVFIAIDPSSSNVVNATSKDGIVERSHLDDDLANVSEVCSFPSSPTIEHVTTSVLDEMVVSLVTNPLVPIKVETTGS